MLHSFKFILLTLGLFALVACEPQVTPFPIVTQPALINPVTPTATLTLAPSATTTTTSTPTRIAPTATITSTPTRIAPTAINPTRTSTPIARATEPSSGWEVRTLLVTSSRMYALMADSRSMLFDSSKMKLLVSDDNGATWAAFAGGLPAAPNCIANVNLDYATRDALYASTCQGLFRWGDGKWTRISIQETWMVAVVYGKPNQLWATAAPNKNAPIIRSDDGGKAWRDASTNLIHFSGIANLGIDPRDTRTAYAIIMPKYGGSYLRRAFVDNAWDTMPTPLNNSQIDVGMTIDGATGDLYVTANGYPQGWQLWRTRNPNASSINAVTREKISDLGNDNWATLLASSTSASGLTLFLKMTPSNCNVSDAKCDPFVQRSDDGGKAWKRMTIKER